MPTLPRILSTTLLAASALGAAGAAHASDVYWSIGIGNAPGYASPPPAYMAPPPVYVAPAPVYVAPPRRPRTVYVEPPPVYVAPPPHVIYRPGRGHYYQGDYYYYDDHPRRPRYFRDRDRHRGRRD